MQFGAPAQQTVEHSKSSLGFLESSLVMVFQRQSFVQEYSEVFRPGGPVDLLVINQYRSMRKLLSTPSGEKYRLEFAGTCRHFPSGEVALICHSISLKVVDYSA